MGLVKKAVYGILIALLAFILQNKFSKKSESDINFGGEKLDKRFEAVDKAFRKNFVDGWERDGAAITVYYKGKKVVDLWGGYADSSSLRKWQQDTISVVYSSSKAVGALCVALLFDQGHLKYDDLLTKYWPGFGKHGKQNVTIQWAMSHMAALPALDENISYEDAKDHNKMRQVLEDQKPYWPPGTASGYHGVTYGWIVDQIVRHSDPRKRGIGQFFREEVAHKHGVDFHLGLPKEHQHRAARMTLPGPLDVICELLYDSELAKFLFAMAKKPSDSPMNRMAPTWLRLSEPLATNDPDLHRLEQTAVLGMGNARSMAQLFNLFIEGKIVGKSTLAEVSKPYTKGFDAVMPFDKPDEKGYGFLFNTLQRPGANNGKRLVGHPGYGGQSIEYDLDNGLVISYVTNGLLFGYGDHGRTYFRLKTAVYDSIEKL